MPALSTLAAIGGLASAGAGVGSAIAGNSAQKALQKQQEDERRRSRQAQLDALGQMQAPQQSESTKRRIKALEEESKNTSLVEDPYFQADRATVVRGGQEALSSVGNAQRASGATGGFSNQGSMSDVYDRVGGQLADLGQKSRELKSKKADTAAQMEQSFLDAQTEHQNAVARARAAIEAGDGAAAQAAIAQAMEARQRQQQSEMQLFGSITGGVTQAFGKDWLGKTTPTAPAKPKTWNAMKGAS